MNLKPEDPGPDPAAADGVSRRDSARLSRWRRPGRPGRTVRPRRLQESPAAAVTVTIMMMVTVAGGLVTQSGVRTLTMVGGRGPTGNASGSGGGPLAAGCLLLLWLAAATWPLTGGSPHNRFSSHFFSMKMAEF